MKQAVTKRLIASYAAAALALLLTACDGDVRAGAKWAGTVDTLANGTVLVSNPEEGIWDEGEGWQLVEELRIGSADVEGPELFGNVSGLAVDAAGRIYVADGQANEVRVFSPKGEFVRALGRAGGGPGEFKQIGGMAWGPDGNLWVKDWGNTRFTVYDTAGSFVTSHVRPGGFVMMPWPGGIDTQGNIYDIEPVRSEGEQELSVALIRYDAELVPQDTFVTPSFEGEAFTHSSEDGRSRMMASVPFAPGQYRQLGPDGHIRIGTNDRYRIVHQTFEGDTVRIVERAYTPAHVSASERDEAIEGLEWFTKQGGKVDASRIPDTKPAFSNFFADPAGYLWVTAQLSEEEGDEWDVFDPDGRYLGRVAKPEGFSAATGPIVRGDRMYAVARDELEVPYVVRYRIDGR